MRSFGPASWISRSAMPRSATMSISSRISLKFKIPTSGELVAQELLRARQLESRPPVVAIGPKNQQHVIVRRHFRNEGDVFLRHQRELQNLAGVQSSVREANRFDEASELRSHDIERNVVAVETLDTDSVEPDQTDGKRSIHTISNALEHISKRHSPPPSSSPSRAIARVSPPSDCAALDP